MRARIALARAGAALARAGADNSPATTAQAVTPTAVHHPRAPTASAAAIQAARAGGTSRRSAGASCHGSAAPSRWPDSACTAGRVTAVRARPVSV
ncbi:hypothetical protein OG293_24585 [Streptomyces sp. NBC_00829]|nr:hypothetical protein OG293_24585 [Streptomyces sp. NBC_00829]